MICSYFKNIVLRVSINHTQIYNIWRAKSSILTIILHKKARKTKKPRSTGAPGQTSY
jgi:hypothetical protein